MKNTLTLAAALVAVALTGSVFAYSPKDPAPPVSASAAKLVPSKVVHPTDLPRTFARAVVNIEFSLDQSDQPRDIKVLSTSDRDLKEKIVQAFSQWRFESAPGELRTESKRFILPLEIVPEV